jgi:hypothetical protein
VVRSLLHYDVHGGPGQPGESIVIQTPGLIVRYTMYPIGENKDNIKFEGTVSKMDNPDDKKGIVISTYDRCVHTYMYLERSEVPDR